MPADRGPGSSVTGDDDRRAEIEAVATWLAGEDGDLDDFGTNAGQVRDYHMDRARNIVAVLARVRDARGDGETSTREVLRQGLLRIASGPDDTARKWAHEALTAAARSPQDEDHETARPEQPPPDTLGGQPPAEPPEAP